jgi:hypothetical protein
VNSNHIAAAWTKAQKTQHPLLKPLCWGYHLIAIQPVHLRADCCLATTCNIRLLRTQLSLLCVGLFTERLPGNALIKSVTICLSSQETIVNTCIWKNHYDPRFLILGFRFLCRWICKLLAFPWRFWQQISLKRWLRCSWQHGVITYKTAITIILNGERDFVQEPLFCVLFYAAASVWTT